MDVGQSTPAASPAGPSRTPTPIDPHIPVQPAFFYPSGHNSVAHPVGPNGFLSPDQDPLATRGIPVFKPTYEEFCDFEKYMTRVEVWGRKSGIVKVIPPKEWSDALPPVKDLLPNLKLRHPIEQHMMGQGGLFRQNNVEKRRVLSLKDWAQLCAKDELKPYPIKDGQVQTRGLSRSTVTRKQRNSKKVKKEDGCELHPDESSQIDASGTPRAPEANVTSSDHAAGGGNVSLDLEGLPSGNVASPSKPKEDKDDPFYAEFDPRTSWLPEGTSADDYTPETCREIERVYWRTCGLGTPAQYGADMAGSLFTDQTKHWNVANLPSFLNRLCSRRSLPGVNTPYLYFGMWRATFAWHVEDMDLYSINYIHWGAPKYWYAIPSERSKAFERVMKGYFPGEASTCPQYLRHKAFLVSPNLLSQSSCRPNTLVQHQGEFVITFPRGYHAGFNLGLNCAESVNFALESWIELGRKAGVCDCVSDSVRIDVDELLGEAEKQRDEEQSDATNKKRKSDNPEDEARKRSKTESSETTAEIGPEPSKARVRLPPVPPTPCCLCASEDKTGLLPVHDPPQPSPSARPLIVKDKGGVERAIWKAHEQCARVIPETWIDEVDGQRFVFGVDAIVKDRWALKCTDCTRTTLKLHGAKIQCAKGKCPKAFHVTCATRAEDVSYKELGEDEKEVVLVVKPPTQDGTTVPGFLDGGSEPAANVVKTIRKLQVEVFCCQHNPLVQQRKKAAKQEQLRKDVLALPPEARVRIRNASGVYEVTVHSVNEGRDTVTVAWGNGQRKEIPWKHIIWGNIPEGTFVQKGEDAVSTNAQRPSTSHNALRPTTLVPTGSSHAVTYLSASGARLPTPVTPAYMYSSPSIPGQARSTHVSPYYTPPMAYATYSQPYGAMPMPYQYYAGSYYAVGAASVPTAVNPGYGIPYPSYAATYAQRSGPSGASNPIHATPVYPPTYYASYYPPHRLPQATANPYQLAPNPNVASAAVPYAQGPAPVKTPASSSTPPTQPPGTTQPAPPASVDSIT